MKKIFFFFALLLCLYTNAQTFGSPGDVAIIGLRTNYTIDNPYQKLAIIAMKDIPANTKITFTDRPWISGQGFAASSHGSDGFFEWTTNTIVTRGTVVTFEALLDFDTDPHDEDEPPVVQSTVTARVGSAIIGTCAVPNNFYWGKNTDNRFNPEQIIIFTGEFTNPSPLWGISTSGWEYKADYHVSTSDLPKVLRDANCFISLALEDNAYFTNQKFTAIDKLTLAGRREALTKSFSNREFYFTPNIFLNFPIYHFQVTNGSEWRRGTPFSEWGFGTGLYNSNGEYPIELQNVDYSIDYQSTELITNNYPANYSSSDNSGGIICAGSTIGRSNIYIDFLMKINAGGANAFQIEYSINNGPWALAELNASTVLFIDAQSRLYFDPVVEVIEDERIIKFANDSYYIFGEPPFANSGEVRVQVALPTLLNNKQNIKIRLTTTADPRTNQYASLHPSISYDRTKSIVFYYLGFWATTSINAIDNASNIILFPNTELNISQLTINPTLVTGGSAIATHEKAQKGAFISVTDAQTGRKLLTQAVAEGSTQNTIPTGSLPKGHLIAEFINGNTKATARFVKQ